MHCPLFHIEDVSQHRTLRQETALVRAKLPGKRFLPSEPSCIRQETIGRIHSRKGAGAVCWGDVDSVLREAVGLLRQAAQHSEVKSRLRSS